MGKVAAADADAKMMCVVIPCFNEACAEKTLLDLIRTLRGIDRSNAFGRWNYSIVLVDDGSTVPLTLRAIERDLEPWESVHLLTHGVNLGQGAALQTGIEYGVERIDADVFITFDSDGQHDSAQVFPLAMAVFSQSVDIVFGTRFGQGFTTGMPSIRRLLLWAGTRFERTLTGLTLSDAHNGFRAFGRKFATCIALKHNRMAHSTEFKLAVKQGGFRYGEMGVHIRYTAQSLAKGQRTLDSFKIIFDLVRIYIYDAR